MGYYTDFQLELFLLDPYEGMDDERRAIIKSDIVNALKEFEDAYFEDDIKSINSMKYDLGNRKWYTYEDDMLVLSEMFPTYIFALYGQGEEKSDIWVKYYLNGKCQEGKGKIVYDQWDLRILK